MNEYIDVRGPWPTYINGCIAVTMYGYDRNATVQDGRKYVQMRDLQASELAKRTTNKDSY